MPAWWEDFFDQDYATVWGGTEGPEKTEGEADGLWELLRLGAGSRVLDAPCGYGRLSRPLAKRGAEVLGVDIAEYMIGRAERELDAVPVAGLRYRKHDLRQPLDETGFDAAFNVFSSIGYGSEEDDLAMFRNIRAALRPGGLFLLDTNHRDLFIAAHSRGSKSTAISRDGALIVQESSFDPIEGRAMYTWKWLARYGGGTKTASFRLYSATELVKLLAGVGFRFVSAHKGCSTEPFRTEGEDAGGRLALLLEACRE